ncbi:alpha/beta fold hydrolase [Halobacillus sp. BBL2006]|uniref:alpha/beta fold hydrolase n=1 Tax=Halobacillus sp. BBL2006 TaxID=1543706 RepID=UPI000541FDDA|nr:alpha/beta hydrolase [Halobacillus sp. BBL2006]KHE66830.1 alpha/beta hydrolase [Halobacillus sp. BBL2006]
MVETTWRTYHARDFTRLQYVFHESRKGQGKYAIILIHGITAELSHQEKFAQAIKVEADVFLPILRGYDQLNKRGDLTYIGHYDNDLFDFIHHIKKMGYEKIILAGHSMGCANILRLLSQNRNIADQFVFISPFFHPTLPVYRDDATEQFKPETDVDYTVYQKKIILLMTLYKMNIHRFSHKTVAIIPDEFDDSGILQLSFRLMASRFLEKIPSDLFEGIENQVFTFVGGKDEVVVAEQLESWYREKFDLELNIIEETDHNHILHDSNFHHRLFDYIK